MKLANRRTGCLTSLRLIRASRSTSERQHRAQRAPKLPCIDRPKIPRIEGARVLVGHEQHLSFRHHKPGLIGWHWSDLDLRAIRQDRAVDCGIVRPDSHLVAPHCDDTLYHGISPCLAKPSAYIPPRLGFDKHSLSGRAKQASLSRAACPPFSKAQVGRCSGLQSKPAGTAIMPVLPKIGYF